MAYTDKARDFWDRISPRERRLVVIAAIAAPITIAIWLGLAIHDGLDAMEARNEKARKALAVLADLRARGQAQSTPADDVVATMGTEPLSLETYLNTAAKKAKFELKSTVTPRTPQTKNGFVTTSSTVQIDKMSIQEVKDFLYEIETGSKTVAVTHLDLRRDFRDKDKLTINLEVSAYSKEKKTDEPAAGSGAGSGDAKKGGT